MEDRFDRILGVLALVVIVGVLIIAANSESFQKSKYSISRVEAAETETPMIDTLTALQTNEVAVEEESEEDGTLEVADKTQVIVAPTVSLDEDGVVEETEEPAAEDVVEDETESVETVGAGEEEVLEEIEVQDLKQEEVPDTEEETGEEPVPEEDEPVQEEVTPEEPVLAAEESEREMTPAEQEPEENPLLASIKQEEPETESSYNYQVLSRVRGLSVRTKPDLDSAILGTLRGNDLIECVNDSYKDWIQIKYNGVLAFVAKQYVTAIEN